jgi:hypothetical protein
MAKGDAYKNLYTYLKESQKIEVILTFEEIEKIINRKLPNSAQIHSEAWWSNNYDHSQAISWIDAGYKTDMVSDTHKKKKIIFIKQLEG